MKLALASDLHFEFHPDGGEWLTARLPAADLLVVAGDLATTEELDFSLALLCRRYQHVIFVAGNHEFYGAALPHVRTQLRHAQERMGNLHVLDNGSCLIEGQRFVGTTMWFPELEGVRELQPKLNDFHCIEDADPLLYRENAEAVSFLRRTVTRDDVVVTHHLPARQSIPAAYAEDPVNCFFLCDVSDLIASVQPRLWIHGHTHTSCDYRIGETRVICNPFGYFGHSTNPEFKVVLLEV